MIITGTLQVLLNALVFGLDAEAAVGGAAHPPPVGAAGADGRAGHRRRRARGAAAARPPRRRRAGRGRGAARPARAPTARSTAPPTRARAARRSGGERAMAAAARRRSRSRWFKLAAQRRAAGGAAARDRPRRDARRARRGATRLARCWRWSLCVASQVVSAYRWCAAGARGRLRASRFARFFTYYFSGMYLNLFGPGTVAGDVGRTLFLAGGRRRALALTTVVAHRAIGFVALVWIARDARSCCCPISRCPGPLRWLAALAVPGHRRRLAAGARAWRRGCCRATNHWRRLIERDLAPYWHDRRLLGAVARAGRRLTHVLQIGSQVAGGAGARPARCRGRSSWSSCRWSTSPARCRSACRASACARPATGTTCRSIGVPRESAHRRRPAHQRRRPGHRPERPAVLPAAAAGAATADARRPTDQRASRDRSDGGRPTGVGSARERVAQDDRVLPAGADRHHEDRRRGELLERGQVAARVGRQIVEGARLRRAARPSRGTPRRSGGRR